MRRSVNAEMVKTYWLIAQEIIEEEQQGKKRSEYGSLRWYGLMKRIDLAKLISVTGKY